MPQEEVDLVLSVIAAATKPGVSKLPEIVLDEDVWERNRERISPNVEVRFVTPGEGGVQVMEQEFAGIEGLMAGWREWMRPWEEFRVAVDEMVDAGPGQLLLLARATARMRGTGAEVPQNVATLWGIEDGKLVAITFYLDQEQARRDAGLA